MNIFKKYLTELIAFVLGFALAFLVLSFYKQDKKQQEVKQQEAVLQEDVKEGEKEDKAKVKISENKKILAQMVSTSTDMNSFDYLKVSDQKAGEQVNVAYVKADFPFWVVVHMEKDGKIWNALGARMKKPGEYSGVVVPLLAKTYPEHRYWVVIYKDNGDGKFSLQNDFPATDANGNIEMLSFNTVK